jgi:hypothetical protein
MSNCESIADPNQCQKREYTFNKASQIPNKTAIIRYIFYPLLNKILLMARHKIIG